MPLKIWLDGKFYDKADAKISVYDHGLLYGDGVFEGIRSYSGRVFRLSRHVDRLYDSARSIHLQVPISKGEMSRAIIEASAAPELAGCATARGAEVWSAAAAGPGAGPSAVFQ